MSKHSELLETVRARELESIRVSFVDQHGILRGKVIMADDLEQALDNGITITSTLLLKDTSHTTVFPIWQSDAGFGKGMMTGASDLLMKPDSATFKVLPWAEHTGWMIADLCFTDGSPVPLSTRNLLQLAEKKLHDKGLNLVCGLEVEFYVYRMDNANLEHHHSGKPQDPPQTSLLSHGYQYLTEQHFDQIEPVMDLIRSNALALGLPVRSMEAEFGPSQFEMTFHPAGAVQTADNMVLFRSMVKQVCRRHGYHATFMCRPNLKNAMGNGWHLHQSVVDKKTGENLFVPEPGTALSVIGAQWVGGILQHAEESCVLSTPTINGYKRYQPFALAPDRIQWGQDNRGAMLRALCSADNAASRIENRVGEPAANPYLYIASQILSGLDGVERKLTPPPAVESPYSAESRKLPVSLSDALTVFDQSKFYRSELGEEFIDYYVHIKRAEWNRFLQTVSDWEHREYFSLF